MRSVLRILRLAVVVVVLPLHANEFWEQPWIEVRSPHFIIVSALSEQRTVELVKGLEDFRAAAEVVIRLANLTDRIPTRIYVFDRRDADFVDTGIAGWFMPRMRANYAVVIPNSSLGFGATIKHEYLHYLLHNADATRYPRWFDEGFATKFETMEVHDKVIEFGQPPPYALQNLQYGTWLSFDTVLGTRNIFKLAGNAREMFYLQSWLLVYYLTERANHDFGAEMRAYLASSEAGARPVDAFNAAFGVRPEQLRPILYDYLRNKLRTTTIIVNEPFPARPIQTAAVTTDSIAAELGALLLLRGRELEAKRYFDAALTTKPDNGAALVGLGDLLKFAGKFDDAQPYYEKAISIEPKNPYHELDYGEYFADRASVQTERLSADSIEARRHFARAYALDPNIPETLAMNGSTYLNEGRSIDKALASLSEAYAMLPAQPDIAMLLARAYAQSNRKADAVKLVRACIAWGSESSTKDADAATELLEKWGASDETATPSTPSSDTDTQ